MGPTQKVISWLAVILFAFPAQRLLSDTAPIRVLTYNIHHGRGTDGRIDLERIARVIRASEADLVALQEVDRRTSRSDGVDQVGRLATLTGLSAAFGKAIDFGDGEYGVAVLSRFEVVASKTHALPSSADREQRVALEVRVRLSSREELTFVSTHFDHTRDATDRVAQAKSINELFATRKPGPVIVAGDLNATPLTAEMKSLGGAWLLAAGESPAPTSPAEKPTRKIDYVLLRRDDAWKVNRTQVMKEPVASDHAPLLVELQHVTAVSETGKQSRIGKGVPDEHGFLVHEVVSMYQAAPTRLRVLLPDNFSSSDVCSVLFVLPVEAGTSTHWGDGLLEVRQADLHNKYDLVCCEPTFSDLPWYCDHPSNEAIRQESYLVEEVIPFVEQEYSSPEQDCLLIGFSKSGWGAMSLLLRHPARIDRVAVWDAPLMQQRPDRYGMGPIFGDQQNFEKYQLSRLIPARAEYFRNQPRMVMLGYGNFRAHHQSFQQLLDQHKVASVNRDGPHRDHSWSSGWLGEAIDLLVATDDK